MTTTQQAAWLRLFLTPGIGRQSIWRLLQQFSTIEAVFTASPEQWQQSLSARQIQALQRPSAEVLQALDLHLQWLQQPQHHLLTPDSAAYPALLREIPDAPVLLFAEGYPEFLQGPGVAIVGSRHASQQGMRTAREFAAELSKQGLHIYSGLAAGIDAAAHHGALSAGGQTCAVVGTGLLHCYPASNQKLAQQLRETGCLLSEYALNVPAIAANFPRRNRLISGLSLGVLVVEAAAQSGSLITARMALEQGREVFAIPGSIHTPQAKGCHQLIREGAKLVENCQHILEDLSFMPASGRPEPIAAGSAQDESALFAWLNAEPIHLSELEQLSGWSSAKLSAEIVLLELQGMLENLPGGWLRRLY